MKKLSVFALMVICAASVAVAASMGVPWFVDNAPALSGIPQATKGVTGIVTLKSNRTDTVVCTIAYYSQEGYFLGPVTDNTFSIAPLSSCAFRPVLDDPDTTVCGTAPNYVACPPDALNNANAGGQEGLQGVLVPNRPRSVDDATPIPGSDNGSGEEVVDTKKNGALTISWVGGERDVQGQVAYFQTSQLANGDKLTMSYAHLLPPGIS